MPINVGAGSGGEGEMNRLVRSMFKDNMNDLILLMSKWPLSELDTMDNPSPRFMDETERIFCGKCKNYFALGRGMARDDRIMALTVKHLELCEGNVAMTLAKVTQWWEAQAAEKAR